MKLKNKDDNLSDKNVDDILLKLEQMEKQFAFYVEETDNIDREAFAIQQSGEDVTPAGSQRLEQLYSKVEELFVRYQKDLKVHDELQQRVNKHFKDKYDIDLDL